jgi:hypothetical protein
MAPLRAAGPEGTDLNPMSASSGLLHIETAKRGNVSRTQLYRLPFEPLAGLLAPVTVRPWLTATFDFRARDERRSRDVH